MEKRYAFGIDAGTRQLKVINVEGSFLATPFPMDFEMTRDLNLNPLGVIKQGSTCTIVEHGTAGIIACHFHKWQPALRDWDNVLLLFPDCVDIPILRSMRCVPRDARRLRFSP